MYFGLKHIRNFFMYFGLKLYMRNFFMYFGLKLYIRNFFMYFGLKLRTRNFFMYFGLKLYMRNFFMYSDVFLNLRAVKFQLFCQYKIHWKKQLKFDRRKFKNTSLYFVLLTDRVQGDFAFSHSPGIDYWRTDRFDG